MTQEDKELLLKDICSRLPYGVKVKDTYYNYNENYQTIWLLDLNAQKVRIFADEDWQSIEYIKPYLFPLSSMTEEQKKEFLSVTGYEAREEDCGRHTETYYYDMVGNEHNFYPNSDAIDWLNKNHFDYRGLIPMGLAIDATGLNIY